MEKLVAIIDDDATFLEVMQEFLEEDHGYRVLLLPDGDTACARVRAALPNTVILDLHLRCPKSGWNILEQLRLDPNLAEIPIIVCSATHEHEILQHSADLQRLRAEVLAKPFNLDDLLSMVRRLIGPGDRQLGA
jgi:CheY-like chemotaxis protein